MSSKPALFLRKVVFIADAQCRQSATIFFARTIAVNVSHSRRPSWLHESLHTWSEYTVLKKKKKKTPFSTRMEETPQWLLYLHRAHAGCRKESSVSFHFFSQKGRNDVLLAVQNSEQEIKDCCRRCSASEYGYVQSLPPIDWHLRACCMGRCAVKSICF